MITLFAFLFGAVCGIFIHRAVIDGLMLAQRDAHHKEMDVLSAELKRARVQVAALIGRE